MLRLTIAARITMIVLVGLAAVWIAAIAAFYASHADTFESVRPPPERIAALADLLERADTAQRLLVLKAVETSRFQPRLVAPGAPLAPAVGVAAADAIRRPYVERLAGRMLDLTVVHAPGVPGWFAGPFADLPNALEFHIGLSTGETLVIATHGPLIVTRLGLPVGFGAGLFGTLVAVAALLIMQRETRPLARLAAAVDRVDLTADAPLLPQARRSAPEIRALIAAFNRLQGRLSGMVKARMALIGGISHDVRTFAARLRLRVERIADEAERQRAVADIDDMIRLLDDALLSSRAGAGELVEEMVDVADLVAGEVEDRRRAGAAISFHCDATAQAAVVLGDRLALRRIVANLADNALKYGEVAGLTLAVREGEIMLTVEDAGPGIPAEQRALMLEPFSRLETSRNRGTGGAGLGLAVVRTLVEAQGGRVEIGEAAGGGGRVMVALPLFRAAT